MKGRMILFTALGGWLTFSCSGTILDPVSGQEVALDPDAATVDTSTWHNGEALTQDFGQGGVIDGMLGQESTALLLATKLVAHIDSALVFLGAPADPSWSPFFFPDNVSMACLEITDSSMTFVNCQFPHFWVDGSVSWTEDSLTADLSVVRSGPDGDYESHVVAQIQSTDSMIDGYACLSRSTPYRSIVADVLLDEVLFDVDRCPVGGTVAASADITTLVNAQVYDLAMEFGPACGEGYFTSADLSNLCPAGSAPQDPDPEDPEDPEIPEDPV